MTNGYEGRESGSVTGKLECHNRAAQFQRTLLRPAWDTHAACFAGLMVNESSPAGADGQVGRAREFDYIFMPGFDDTGSRYADTGGHMVVGHEQVSGQVGELIVGSVELHVDRFVGGEVSEADPYDIICRRVTGPGLDRITVLQEVGSDFDGTANAGKQRKREGQP